MAEPTKVPKWIAWPILGVLVGGILFHYAFTSQRANLRRVEKWIESHKAEFEELQKEREGLRRVQLGAYTAENGMLIVRSGKLSSEDAAALYRFLLERRPPRPVRIAIPSSD